MFHSASRFTFLISCITDDEEDGGAEKKEKRDKKRLEEDESVFQRLEESRQMLEQQLGIDKFLRVYKFLQVIICLLCLF